MRIFISNLKKIIKTMQYSLTKLEHQQTHLATLIYRIKDFLFLDNLIGDSNPDSSHKKELSMPLSYKKATMRKFLEHW